MPKVLVMDNDSDLLMLLRGALSKVGYEVECLTDGCPVVNNRIEIPDLFVIDKGLNIIDGIAICKYLKLKNETSNIPIVMISGEEFREKALLTGADYFMTKPLKIKNLLQVIDSLLHNDYSMTRHCAK